MDTTSPSACPALLAEVTRGSRVESRHFGHAVVVNSRGEVLYAIGDPEHPTFPRSSLKPIQALAAVARGTADVFSFSDEEIAVTCASHQAEPHHRESVGNILKKIDAAEVNLQCGPHSIAYPPVRDELIRVGISPTALYNNCSGKHAGMLALARVLDVPLEGYWEPEHPVQREVRRAIGVTYDMGPDSLAWGMDGCGVPNYLLPLRNLALGFARLAEPSSLNETDAGAARRIVAAMGTAPEMVSGDGRMDTVFMRALPGIIVCKGGAEGVEAVAVLGQGLGIAVKIEDGTVRALPPIILSLIKRFDALPDPLPPSLEAMVRPVLTNSCGQAVGEITRRCD